MRTWLVVAVCILAIGFTTALGVTHRGTPSTPFCPGVGQWTTDQPCPPDERGIG